MSEQGLAAYQTGIRVIAGAAADARDGSDLTGPIVEEEIQKLASLVGANRERAAIALIYFTAYAASELVQGLAEATDIPRSPQECHPSSIEQVIAALWTRINEADRLIPLLDVDEDLEQLFARIRGLFPQE